MVLNPGRPDGATGLPLLGTCFTLQIWKCSRVWQKECTLHWYKIHLSDNTALFLFCVYIMECKTSANKWKTSGHFCLTWGCLKIFKENLKSNAKKLRGTNFQKLLYQTKISETLYSIQKGRTNCLLCLYFPFHPYHWDKEIPLRRTGIHSIASVSSRQRSNSICRAFSLDTCPQQYKILLADYEWSSEWNSVI